MVADSSGRVKQFNVVQLLPEPSTSYNRVLRLEDSVRRIYNGYSRTNGPHAP